MRTAFVLFGNWKERRKDLEKITKPRKIIFFSFLLLAATFRLRVLLASCHAWNFTRDFSTQNLKQESCQVNHSLTKVNCERLFIGFFWLQLETEHGFESFWAFEFLLNVKKSTPLWKFLRQTCFKLTIESLALMEYFSWTSSQPWLCGVLKSAKVEIIRRLDQMN